jgi:putative hydrolase of the HAD superfamily
MTVPRLVVFDLDDTLFPECAYVRSGFAAVDGYVRARWRRTGFFEVAWGIYAAGGRGLVFDEALAQLGIAPGGDDIGELVRAYRDHHPDITLFPDVEDAIAIVSDGPLASQKRKIEALRLDRFFSPIILTDQWGPTFWKPHPRAFRELEAATGCTRNECAYVGDNPRKDFAAPHGLGWRTVRVRRQHGEHSAVDAPAAAEAECAGLRDVLHLLGLSPGGW